MLVIYAIDGAIVSVLIMCQYEDANFNGCYFCVGTRRKIRYIHMAKINY